MKDKYSDREKESETPLLIAIILTIVILGHLVTFGFLLDNSFYTKVMPNDSSIQLISESNSTQAIYTLNNKGLLGDFFSGHFTFLAFIWMTYAVIVQRKEYRLQREEFEEQTEEFKLQRHQFEEQNLHARYNRLHNLLSETYYNIEYMIGDKNYKGLSALFLKIRLNPGSSVVLKHINVVFKFMLTYQFIENEVNELLSVNHTDEEKRNTIKNIKKEFILQWSDIYVSCLKSYTIVTIAHIQDKETLEIYLNTDLISPMMEKEPELIDIGDRKDLIKYVDSINYPKDISKYFVIEEIDFNNLV